ncbi:neuronal-specific septin-3 isoform X2 [Poecilia reticulata]|uniref:neuronal-specific septin-3 isoform X2 n=1 Tax=Poecilia reticulata TaxID=8081 RepID=UPI0007EC1DD2|nr:PREDICTED: zinc finger CCCH domain-containing protein 18-like isoform X2 [Poecilia reticulata]
MHVCFGTRQAAHRPHSDFTVPSGANQTGHQSGSGTVRAQRRKMARMALVRPLLPTSLLIVLHSQACLLSQSDGNRETIRHQVVHFTCNRMSVFHRHKPLMSGTSSSCRQTNELPKVCQSPPLSLSSPVIKKKAILLPSFDEKGLIFEKGNSKLSAVNRSNDVISSKTSCQLMRGKECLNSQKNYGERASTLPRTKSSTHNSLTVSAKPNICVSPAPQPNSSPTLRTLKPRPRDSLLPPSSVLGDFHPIPQQPDQKPRVSPTLTVPTPRRTPSPSSATDSQQERQPSPVALERHARSISISNTAVEPANKIKHDVLDQGALLNFTHPGNRRVCRETRQTDSCRLPALCHNSCKAQSKAGLKKTEITVTEKPKTPNRNSNIATMLTPKPIAELQKQCEPKEVTRHFDAFPSELDASSIKSRLRSRLTDYNLGSNYTHTSECTTYDQSFQKTDCSKRTKLTKSSLSADSQISLNSDKSETRRRQQFNLDTETRVKPEALSLNSKSSQNQRSAPNQALRLSTQTDVKTTVSRSERPSQDFSCQSSDFGQISLMSGSAQRLNQVKTQIEASQSLGILQSAYDEPLYSQDGAFSNPDVQAKHPWNQEMTKQCENHREMNFSHAVLNQLGVCKTPDHNVGPEYPWAPSMAGRPFNRNRSGHNSRRVSEWPQQIVYQPSAETQACQQKHSGPDRAIITEDSEDPYYVTMYYPDSVYVAGQPSRKRPTR